MLALLAATWLVFTLPASGQHVWTDPSQGPDSTMVECSGGPTIRALRMAYLERQPFTGGGFAVVDSHSVAGREGQPDSFRITLSGHYRVRTKNNLPTPSCPSNVATWFADSIRTGVEPLPGAQERVFACTLFDVQGRRVGSFSGDVWRLRALSEADLRRGVTVGRLPSGVYWLRGKTAAGWTKPRRVVVAR